MGRDEAIDRLRGHADQFRAHGVTGMYLFGSAARGEETASSDIDVFYDYLQDGHFSLFEMMELQEEVEDVLRAKADVVPRNSLHRRIRDRIEREAIRIF